MRVILMGATVAVAMLVSGCSTTLKATAVDGSGRFPTTTLLKADAVKTRQPFDPKFKPMVYVKTDEKLQQYNEFFSQSFANMKVFDKVLLKSDVEKLVFERQLTDKVSSVSDLIGLNQLQKQIGPFLVVEPYVEWKGGYDFTASMKAVDPSTGETLLLIEQKAFNWAGLDKPLFFPLLNGVLDWATGQEIKVAPASKASK